MPIRFCASVNASAIGLLPKSVKSKDSSLETAPAAVLSATEALPNALMETSSSGEIIKGLRGNLLLESVDGLDGNHRFPKFAEFLCQVATESDEGKGPCLERPAKAAGFLQEFYVSSWQHELAQ